MSAELVLIAGLLAMVATISTILTALWKALNAIASLRYGISELHGKLDRINSEIDGKLERLELITNGYRERIEHINTRVSTHLQRLDDALDDIEAFLQKTTSYEKRRGR